jgi:hypothetical protein
VSHCAYSQNRKGVKEHRKILERRQLSKGRTLYFAVKRKYRYESLERKLQVQSGVEAVEFSELVIAVKREKLVTTTRNPFLCDPLLCLVTLCVVVPRKVRESSILGAV